MYLYSVVSLHVSSFELLFIPVPFLSYQSCLTFSRHVLTPAQPSPFQLFPETFSTCITIQSINQRSNPSIYDPVHPLKICYELEPILIEVNEIFHMLRELKLAVKEFALANNFEPRTIKVDQYRYRVKCRAEGCPWLLARPVNQSLLWRVKEFNDTHTCFPPNHGDNSVASAEFLAIKILE